MCYVMFFFSVQSMVYIICVYVQMLFLISYLQIVQEMFLLFCHGYDCN